MGYTSQDSPAAVGFVLKLLTALQSVENQAGCKRVGTRGKII